MGLGMSKEGFYLKKIRAGDVRSPVIITLLIPVILSLSSVPSLLSPHSSLWSWLWWLLDHVVVVDSGGGCGS